jgi:hypothetical protein
VQNDEKFVFNARFARWPNIFKPIEDMTDID